MSQTEIQDLVGRMNAMEAVLASLSVSVHKIEYQVDPVARIKRDIEVEIDRRTDLDYKAKRELMMDQHTEATWEAIKATLREKHHALVHAEHAANTAAATAAAAAAAQPAPVANTAVLQQYGYEEAQGGAGPSNGGGGYGGGKRASSRERTDWSNMSPPNQCFTCKATFPSVQDRQMHTAAGCHRGPPKRPMANRG